MAAALAKPPVGELPDGLRPIPGPCSITAARYDDSPVGPYRELAVGQPARLGARLGMCITTMAVTSVDSRLGGRMNWGFAFSIVLGLVILFGAATILGGIGA